MPSASPGAAAPSSFNQILPGAPNDSLQSVTTFVYRHERYVAYISGSQLSLLSAPNTLVHTVHLADNLTSVTAHITSGRVVVATHQHVYLLEPVTEGWSRIWWEKKLILRCEDEPQCLSWSKDDELLVGGSRYINLFSTTPSSRNNSPSVAPLDGAAVEERKPLWSEVLASPVQYACFNSTAEMIASCGRYSRLIKIWRRLSFEEGLFDYTYLPHSAIVTHLEWRTSDVSADGRRGSGISRRHDEDLEVLYTITNDGVLSVWRSAGIHDIEILTLYTTIDLVAAIPHSPTLNRGSDKLMTQPRFVFILTSDEFNTAVLAATGRVLSGKFSHSLEHLKEISSNSPDVIVSVDGQGRMSAWGLQSVGHKRRPEVPNVNSPFHIMQTEGLPLKLSSIPAARFNTWFEEDRLQILAHTFDGRCTWWQGQAETFFSHATPGAERLQSLGQWAGHTAPPQGLRLTQNGSKDLISWDSNGTVVLWEEDHRGKLQQSQSMRLERGMVDVLSLSRPNRILGFNNHHVKLWDMTGRLLDEVEHSLWESTTARLYGFGDNDLQQDHALLLDSHGMHQTVSLTDSKHLAISTPQQIADGDIIAAVVADHEAAQPPVFSLDATGRIRRSYVSQDRSGTSKASLQYEFDTGITNTDNLTVSNKHIVVLSNERSRITVFDAVRGYKEHEEDHKRAIHLVACHSPQAGGSKIAVAFSDSVQILLQERYHSLGPWTHVQSVSVDGLDLEVRGLTWNFQGELLVLAGNGVLQPSMNIRIPGLAARSYVGTDRLVGYAATTQLPLPIWHPDVLQHLVCVGRASSASIILRALSDKLRFWTEGDHMPWLLDLSVEDLSLEADGVSLGEDVTAGLLEQLAERGVPLLTTAEQEELKMTIATIGYTMQHIRGLDLCALRYLFSWKLGLLHLEATKNGPNGHAKLNREVPAKAAALIPDMSWREITFAYHSTTQQPLWDLLILHYDNKMTWDIARRLGVTMWLSDREALARVFESLAQSAYRATDPPDPTNASLYFLALNKKPTLLSLWRIATWHNEQRMTMNFLKRDFAQASAQTAAKKNAYALMGRRRFEYAAAFFLLASDGSSAVSLLAGQCEDVMLAVAVARLYADQAGGSVLQKLLQERLLPQAEEANDRWLMCWCHSLLGQRHEAADVLVSPLQGVRNWQQDDPQTLVLYRLLRKGQSSLEYDAVLRAAALLRRMGLWLPAVNLVRGWAFEARPALSNGMARATHENPTELETHRDAEAAPSQPPSMLNDYAAPAPVNDKAAREAKAAELLKKLKAKKTAAEPASEPKSEAKREPTQFKEPDANSLLDSFGF